METVVKVKYEVRVETVAIDESNPVDMLSYYNDDGKYIGDTDAFRRLVVDREIDPITYDDNKVCSIGKSRMDGKWYGWSHRAICGFQIGDEVKEGDCCASSGWTEKYLENHPDDKPLPIGFVAETEEDCKKMAIAFASSVS